MERYDKYMELALEEARQAALEDEVPIGCVIVYHDQVIASAHNQRDKSHNPLGHAEMLAIKRASDVVGDWQLVDCELYVTIEPCIMCGGAIIQSRIGKVIYGAPDSKGGAFGGSIDILTANNINHRPEIIGGVLVVECSQIIRQYFKNKRTTKQN